MLKTLGGVICQYLYIKLMDFGSLGCKERVG